MHSLLFSYTFVCLFYFYPTCLSLSYSLFCFRPLLPTHENVNVRSDNKSSCVRLHLHVMLFCNRFIPKHTILHMLYMLQVIETSIFWCFIFSSLLFGRFIWRLCGDVCLTINIYFNNNNGVCNVFLLMSITDYILN